MVRLTFNLAGGEADRRSAGAKLAVQSAAWYHQALTLQLGCASSVFRPCCMEPGSTYEKPFQWPGVIHWTAATFPTIRPTIPVMAISPPCLRKTCGVRSATTACSGCRRIVVRSVVSRLPDREYGRWPCDGAADSLNIGGSTARPPPCCTPGDSRPFARGASGTHTIRRIRRVSGRCSF